VFIHLDGGNANIYAESDDGTTEVAATDTTIDFTAGVDQSPSASRCGSTCATRPTCKSTSTVALVLGSTVFNVNVAAGPWKLLLHIEKTATTDTYELDLHWLRARIAEN
jgi:hypothetical protein